MYYDRPRKRPKTPRASGQTEYAHASSSAPPPARRSLFSRLSDRRARRELERQEALAREEALRRRALARERRHAAWRFFFATPNHRAPDADPPEERSRRPKRHLTVKFLCLLLAAIFLCAAGLYIAPVNLLGSHSAAQFLADASLPSGYTHILIMGIDRDSSGTSRTDTMMVLSVGSGGLCLTSLMRDTGVTIPGHSGSHRLNAAYAYGGAELSVQTVNQNFGFNITRYALVDYDSFPALIDLLGGVTLSVSDAEAQQINHNVGEILYRAYKTGQSTYDEAYARYQSQLLPCGGENLLLSGMQALGYARIRNLDSDYGRTSRQRKVLLSLANRLKSRLYRPLSLIRFAVNALSLVETNMTVPEILSLGEKALLSGSIRETRLPVNGTYTDSGSMFYDIDFAANHNAFVEFVYGK